MSFQNETPIRILAIAPYESMKVSLVHAAEHFPGISMDVYTGDLEEGVSIVKSRDTTRYDVILSRGGTAGLIREVTDLPVISSSARAVFPEALGEPLISRTFTFASILRTFQVRRFRFFLKTV